MTSEKYTDTAPERSDQCAAIPTIASQVPKRLDHIHRACSSGPEQSGPEFSVTRFRANARREGTEARNANLAKFSFTGED